VYDEKHARYVPVPAVDQDYTKGLTMYQHNVIRRYVRERLKKDVDIVALCRAKWEIQEIVEREWKRIKGTTRMKMARFRNEGVQKRTIGADKHWIDEMLKLPEGQEKLLLMSPDAAANSRKGISDVGNTQEINGDGEMAIQSNADDGKGFIELPLNSIAGKSEKPVKKKSDKGAKRTLVFLDPPAELEETKDHEVIANSEVSVMRDDLDMTGWTADYNLPA
jgi:putative transposase